MLKLLHAVIHTHKIHKRLDNFSPPAFQCGTCDECFEKPRTLKKHVQQEHSETFFVRKCIVCRENITQIETGRHLCVQQGQVECEYCKKGFNSTSRLLRHLSIVHKDKKILECDRCQHLFGMQLLLDWHIQSHDRTDKRKEGELRCAKCFRSFTSPINLEEHKKNPCTRDRNGERKLGSFRDSAKYINAWSG